MVPTVLLSEDAEGFRIAYVHVTDVSSALLLIWGFLMVTFIIKVFLESIHFTALPESASIILIGTIGGVIYVLASPEGTTVSLLEFDPEIFFLLLIPPIIYESGYFLQKDLFFDNLSTILLYAVVGTLLNTVTVGALLYGFESLFLPPLSFLECLTFAALISAVDPVAVLAIFSESHVNDTLNVLVFGESVLNDAVSIVIFGLFRDLSLAESVDPYIAGLAIVRFLYVALVGMLIGIFFGMLVSFFTKYTEEIHVMEPLIVFVMGIASYIIAEIISASGIVAILFCGMVASHYVEANISKKSHITIKYLLQSIAGVADTIIFIELGFNTALYVGGAVPESLFYLWDPIFLVLTILIILPVRFIYVFILTDIANRSRIQKIHMKDQFIMGYGGLRGAIAFALAFALPEEIAAKGVFLTTTLAVIWFTVFIQGGTIKYLLKFLDIDLAGEKGEGLAAGVLTRPFSHITEAIKTIAGGSYGVFGWRHFWHDVDRAFSKLLVRKLKANEADLIQAITSIKKRQINNISDTSNIEELDRLMQTSRAVGVSESNLRKRATSMKSPTDTSSIGRGTSGGSGQPMTIDDLDENLNPKRRRRISRFASGSMRAIPPPSMTSVVTQPVSTGPDFEKEDLRHELRILKKRVSELQTLLIHNNIAVDPKGGSKSKVLFMSSDSSSNSSSVGSLRRDGSLTDSEIARRGGRGVGYSSGSRSEGSSYSSYSASYTMSGDSRSRGSDSSYSSYSDSLSSESSAPPLPVPSTGTRRRKKTESPLPSSPTPPPSPLDSEPPKDQKQTTKKKQKKKKKKKKGSE